MKGPFIFIMFVLQKVACFAQLAPKDPFLVAGSLGAGNGAQKSAFGTPKTLWKWNVSAYFPGTLWMVLWMVPMISPPSLDSRS